MTVDEGGRSGVPNGRGDVGRIIADLYTTEREALLRYAGSLTHDRSRAEDLVQEAFVRAMSHLDLLVDLTRGQRRAWLYRVLGLYGDYAIRYYHGPKARPVGTVS